MEKLIHSDYSLKVISDFCWHFVPLMLKFFFFSKFIFLMLFIEIKETLCVYALEFLVRQ